MLKAADLRMLEQCQADLLAWDGSVPIEEHFLRVLPALIQARVLALQSFDFQNGQSQLQTDHDEPEITAHADAFFAHLQQHPLIQATRADGNLPATRISDLVSTEAFERTALYNEFYRRVGFSHQLSVSLPASKGDVIGLVYSRDKDFTAAEREMLGLTRLYVLQLYRQAKRFEFLMRKIRQQHDMLEALEEGLIALSASLKVQQMTARATDLLRRHFPTKGAGHAASKRHLPQALNEWAEEAVKSADPAHYRFATPTSAGFISARLCRMPKGWLLRIEEETTHVSSAGFRHLGLTARESEVLSHLARGKSNTTIATELQASPRTIEKHVENVLKKLGVETRGAAVAAVRNL